MKPHQGVLDVFNIETFNKIKMMSILACNIFLFDQMSSSNIISV
jgi:hypothetical protein